MHSDIRAAESAHRRWLTRRHFFADCQVGLGSIALASLMGNRDSFGKDTNSHSKPFGAKETHFPARAKSVIFLFMAGGPSQLELFDFKPKLQELNDQVIP